MAEVQGGLHAEGLGAVKRAVRVPLGGRANLAALIFKPGTLRAQRFLTAVDMRYPQYLEEVCTIQTS